MSTHSLPSLKDSSLAPDKLFVPRRDLRSSSTAASSPTDMSSVVVPRSFPGSSGQIAEGGSSVARVEQDPSPSGSKYDQGQEATRGGQDGRVAAPVSSSGDCSVFSKETNTPTHSHNSDMQRTGRLGDEQANTAAVPAPAQSSDRQPATNTPGPLPYSQEVDVQQDVQEHIAALRAVGHSSDGQNPESSKRRTALRHFMAIQYHLATMLFTKNERIARLAPQEKEDNSQPIGVDVGAQPQTSVGAPKHVDEARQFNPTKEDYEQVFPEDPYGEEAGPNARVFKVYNEEAATYDEDMIGQCGDSSDVLLIFAGLFSAVLTTFVAQTSQALETDKIAVSNSLLSEIVHLLRAQENGTSFGEVAPAITETSPSGNDLWVNGLWFTSLTLSLATALFAVLTKQWLRQYRMKTSGTIRDRSLIRQFRFAGMKKWHVVTIIGILPILLHLALGVFLVGLSVFLIPRSLPLACIVSVITVVIFSLYFVSNLLPVLHIQCPYRTPFSDILNILAHLHLPIDTQNSLISALNSVCKHLSHVLPFFPPETCFYPRPYHLKVLSAQEVEQAQRQSGSLSLDIIEWLMDTSSNPSVHVIAVEAIGGLPLSQRGKVNIGQNITRELIQKCLILPGTGTARDPTCRPGCAGKLERLARAFPLCRTEPILENDLTPTDRTITTTWKPKLLWDIYTIFRDLEDIRGMVSAVGLDSLGGKLKGDCAAILDYLFDSENDHVSLSPSAWINLFQNIHDLPTRYKFQICDYAVYFWNPSSPSWNDQTAPVLMRYALTRASLASEAVFSAFRLDEEWTLYTPISQDSLLTIPLPQPDSPRLHALLTISRFLTTDSSIIDPSRNLFCLSSVWERVHQEVIWNATANDCSVVFHTASMTLLQSPLLQGDGWMVSLKRSGYCYAILASCDNALSRAPSLQGLRWTCAERVAEITFSTGDVVSEDFTSTREKAGRLWSQALARDMEDAYTNFIKFDVLGHHPSTLVKRLVEDFDLGLLRRLASPPPHPEWFMACIGYIHEPDNLLKACKILGEYWDSDIRLLELARIDPDNKAWEECRETLGKWRPETAEYVAKFTISLRALDSFFETRARQKDRLNTLSLFRSLLGRRGNASVVLSPHTDVEKGLVGTSSPRTEFTGNTNPVVAGRSTDGMDELDRGGGENGQDPAHSGDSRAGSQPPTEGFGGDGKESVSESSLSRDDKDQPAE